MEGRVCATQLAESDDNTLSSTPFAASLNDGDKLINTKIKSAQTKGNPSDQDLMKGLLSDDYCHVCDTVLLLEPHRHYEGEKHNQKVKMYLESQRTVGTMSKDSGEPKKDVPTHIDFFCKLCNMMFCSPVVAMSHFKGKVHAQNLRRQPFEQSKELNQPGLPTHSGQTQASYNVKPAVCTATIPGQDLKDPNYCALCSAPFNNPKMALQHYNGRKHQRNKHRAKVMQGLGEDAQQGNPSDQDLMKGLLSDDYCHVCDTVLLFEPHRHYEGEKHNQKVKMYLESQRAVGTMSKDSGELKKDVPTQIDLFCKLCNMMFCSPVVAMSHFKGKVHAQNLRRQPFEPSKELNQPGLPTHSGQTQASYNVKPAVCTAAIPGQDLKDPNYCALCSAPFNNPKMALQHYNGRKHQRNKHRAKVMQGLGEDAQQARGLICQVCNARFTSMEMYQAHMKGNKHQVKEKKVIDLCKSQPKDYSSFADELADYIQVQKARGINTPAASHLTPQGGKQKDGDSAERDPRDSVHHRIYELNCPPVIEPPSSKPLLGPGYPAAGWGPPPYQPGPSFPHPALFPSTGARYPPNPNRPGARKRHSEQSSSSSYSSSSSSSSSSSDSEEEEKRKGRRHRSGREKRLRERDSEEEVWRAQRRKRVRRNRSQERRVGGGGEEGGITHTESSRRGHRDPIRRRRPERSHEESVEAEGAEEKAVAVKDLKARNPSEMQKELVATHPEAQITPEQAETQMAMPLKPKPRKEKKKQREMGDKRTEEEKLWDESMGLF
ncbi:unnamed protein product [Arctogadus glacialis]